MAGHQNRAFERHFQELSKVRADRRKLKEENEALRAENARLRGRLTYTPPPPPPPQQENNQSGGGGGGGGGTAQGDWRAMLTAAVSEARAVLALAPDDTFAGRGAGSFKRCDAQVLLARMLFTELGMTPQHEQKAEPDRVKAQAKETFELAAAALKGARHHNDQRVAMLAGQLMQAVQQGAKPNA